MISPELVSILVSIPVLVGIRQRWIARKACNQMKRRLEQVCKVPPVSPERKEGEARSNSLSTAGSGGSSPRRNSSAWRLAA